MIVITHESMAFWLRTSPCFDVQDGVVSVSV